MANAANTQFAVGVHAMTLLSALPETKQSSEILAGSIGTNPVHVRRVMAHLRDAGLVESRPGVGGGWRILKAPDQVTLAEIWRAVRGDSRILGIHGANPNCAVGQSIQGQMEAIDDRAVAALEDELARTTLSDLVFESSAAELHSPSAVPA